jgi:hypothetical protein
MSARVTGRDIILGVLDNMQEGLEPLLYTTLAPGLFDVYLHSSDYERLAGILLLITDEAKTALDKAIDELNRAAARPWKLPFDLPFAQREPTPPMKWLKPTGGWSITFHQNVDDEVKPGELLIESSLALPEKPEMGAGMGTKKVRTMRSAGASRSLGTHYEYPASEYAASELAASGPNAGHTAAKVLVSSPASFSVQKAAAHAVARFSWRDKRGAQTFLMTTSQIVAGRGGTDHWVDLKLDASSDISREHFRLRRDEKTGSFFIRDLSSYGTAVNGKKLPSSLEEANGAKRDIQLECPLPKRARLELANTLVIEFEALEVRPT